MINKKITVLVICYNQEKLIGKTLDSILCQKEWGLHHIVIGDDCSTDHTWDVLMNYKQKYPDIVLPIRQERNAGIYGNMEFVKNNRGTADLFVHCSGDDPLMEGFFETVQRFVHENSIDTTEAVGIYSDYKIIAPDGKETVFHQDAILSGYNPWSLYIRRRASSRSLVLSEKVLERFEPIILDKGLNLAECMYDSQCHLNIEKAYYMPVVTSIYYSQIGISTKLHKSDYHTTQARIKLNYILENYAKDERDISVIKCGLQKNIFRETPRLRNIYKILFYYKKGKLQGLNYSWKTPFLLIGSCLNIYLKKHKL